MYEILTIYLLLSNMQSYGVQAPNDYILTFARGFLFAASAMLLDLAAKDGMSSK